MLGVVLVLRNNGQSYDLDSSITGRKDTNLKVLSRNFNLVVRVVVEFGEPVADEVQRLD